MKYLEIIDRMTLEEKAFMMSGKDTWQTVGYKKYGIPSMFLSDGPHGLRKQAGASDHLGLNESLKATCFPTAATIANSWNIELGEVLGKCLGEEAVMQDVQVLLGPGLNIKRSPLCGRNFEYFSEDPYLAGKMAAAYVRGIQSQGVVSCPKHFAANSQELRKMSNDSVVDERTFREIYTTGFEIAVKEGKAKAIMSAYNRINGVYANENEHLLREILVDEWGFQGFVVSDWGGSNDHILGVKNGSHLEMPSTGADGSKAIVDSVKSGVLPEKILDERLDELLKIVMTTDKKVYTEKFDIEKHHKIARRAATESIVLLKNDDDILPLKKDLSTCIIGDFAKLPRFQGAGSSVVNPTKLDITLDVISDYEINYIGFEKGYERTGGSNQTLVQDAVDLAKRTQQVILYLGLDEISESEGLDRIHMKMPQNQIDLLDAVFEVNKNIIVVISAGSVVEMPWLDKVKAVIHGYLGGQAGATAMLDVLTGIAFPSGKLNETYPVRYEDTPAYHYYPGKEKSSEYREGLYVGYRYYETAGIPVLFPFGYGMSYTTFVYTDLQANEKEVTFTLRNSGTADGAEIAQVYVGTRSEQIYRPVKELKGFIKVFLKAGESQAVSVQFDDKAFRYYDVKTGKWEVESGIYHIMVGASVQDIRLKAEVSIKGTKDYDRQEPYSNYKTGNYYSANIRDISKSEYEEILGHSIPDGNWNKDGLLDINDALCQMYYAKNPVARLAYRIITNMKNKSEAKGKPNLNILFIYNMPFRGIAKMTGGALSMDMAKAILFMVNGHFFRGLKRLIKGFTVNRKVIKEHGKSK
ncbi:glycoside hydrolase family 3 C-terminal domain-containing protein [[Clostridium] fimetarium]|uniref:Beta-glucosidase n=1 Tax=[Clostridium] fimetarium TaxID=99656 RepID=A0A1I0PGK1_9FIRM|nr:glycoside hydrolase family 3 C-terminal domain-containing protein [[Clostridium] fimetarium]SEW13375.1 beta-glucosidase [[Clostridium] fimetarium]